MLELKVGLCIVNEDSERLRSEKWFDIYSWQFKIENNLFCFKQIVTDFHSYVINFELNVSEYLISYKTLVATLNAPHCNRAFSSEDDF